MLALSLVFTSCEDILGTWDRPAPVKPTPDPDPTTPGLLAGKFTINASGDKVQFSQGNLQYQASTNTWRFAENQYEYIGDAVGNNTATVRDTQADWIDLFGWGTAGHNIGTGYGTAYQPWEVDQSGTNYGPTGTSNGLYGTYAQGDWGTNAISNGGNTPNYGWRTLTGGDDGEWKYLLYDRTTTSGIHYARAKVNGVNGLILLPDDWDTSYYALNSTDILDAAFTANVITSANWTDKLEAHGCVFLPSAGYRDGTSMHKVGDFGCYWSSSPNDSDTSYYMYFNSFTLVTSVFCVRYYGYSVRLVRPAE